MLVGHEARLQSYRNEFLNYIFIHYVTILKYISKNVERFSIVIVSLFFLRKT